MPCSAPITNWRLLKAAPARHLVVALMVLAVSGIPGLVHSPVVGSAAEEGANAPFVAGFSVLAYGNSPDFRDDATLLLDRLASLHATSVSFVFPVFQESWTAVAVTPDDELTPTDASIATFAALAEERNLSVMLRPILDERSLMTDNKWRGSILPDDVDAWFASYTDLIVGYAETAERAGIEVLCIGTELLSLEGYTDHWVTLIEQVRTVYSGKVGYSFNWDRDWLGQPIGFTPELDFVGIDAFYPLDVPAGASVEELMLAWRPWIDALLAIQANTGKTVILTEIGTRSQAGSYQAPWIWRNNAPVSEQDQARYFAAFCQAAAGLNRVSKPE